MTLRENTRSLLKPTRRYTLVVASLVTALTIAACGGPTPASGDIHPGAAEGDAVEVIAVDNEFEPTTLEFEPGTQVTIEVDNQGQVPHNLVIDEIDLSTGTLEAGDVANATFVVPENPVTFYCSFHPGMKGQIQPTTS